MASAEVPPPLPRFGGTPLDIAPIDTTDKSAEILGSLGLSGAELERASPILERERLNDARSGWPPPLKSQDVVNKKTSISGNINAPQ